MLRLRELRYNKNRTQAQVASFLGITTAQYQRYEVGRSYPRAEDLPRLADYFDVSISALFDPSEVLPQAATPAPVPEVQKLFDKLDENEQAAVIQMMKTLIKGKK